MGNAEIEQFLSYLANQRKVSSSTQNQALCAIIFVYKHILKREIIGLAYSFTKQPRRMPCVLSEQEVRQVLLHLKGKYWLITALLYGCGLRINEALKLRVKDIDFDNHTVFIFRGKGGKDRYSLLPKMCRGNTFFLLLFGVYTPMTSMSVVTIFMKPLIESS